MDNRQREQKNYNQSQYAKKRNEDNKRFCDTLTPDQHDFLSWLCEIRHFLHVETKNKIWSGSDTDINKYIGDCLTGDIGEINEKLIENGFNELHFHFYDDCDNINTYDVFCDTDEEKEDAKSEAIDIIENIVEYNDQIIIVFLREIDKKHNTNYAPTGCARNKI